MLRLDPQSLQLRFSPPASHNYPYLHPTIIQPDSQSFNQIHNLSTEFVFFLCFLRAHCFFQSGLSDVQFTEKFSTLSIAYNFPVLYLIVFFNFSRMAISQTIWKTGKKWFLQKTRKALSCFGGNVEEEETYIPFERVDDDIACLTSAPIVEVVVESPADACPVQVPDVPFRFPVPQEVEQRSGKYQAQITESDPKSKNTTRNLQLKPSPTCVDRICIQNCLQKSKKLLFTGTVRQIHELITRWSFSKRKRIGSRLKGTRPTFECTDRETKKT